MLAGNLRPRARRPREPSPVIFISPMLGDCVQSDNDNDDGDDDDNDNDNDDNESVQSEIWDSAVYFFRKEIPPEY